MVADLNRSALMRESGTPTVQNLETLGYSGTLGDGLLKLNGLAGVDIGNGVVRLILPNNRPALDPNTGTYAADQAAAGVNATVEVFEHKGSDAVLVHLLTIVMSLYHDPKPSGCLR